MDKASTLEITIQRRAGDGWPVVVEESRPDIFLPVQNQGLLQLDGDAEAGLLEVEDDPREYGTRLGKALFRDQVSEAFVRAAARSQDYLRVLLFVEAEDLRTLRWERLCAPQNGGWDFLSLDQRHPFSLYIPSLTDRRFPPIGRRDLRALVVAASPAGIEQYKLEPFDVRAAVESVRTGLGTIPGDVLAPLDVEGSVGPPTLDQLCERITAGAYTLLHVVCHGQVRARDKDTVIYLASGDGQVDAVTGSQLLERLSRLRGARGLPHFAFLSTCESASAEAEGAFGGLAQRLVRELGMPAVLAMTEAVTVETAQALATGFYSRLREHGEVDLALAEACAGLAERDDITVPALFSRLGGRPLFSDTLTRELTGAEIEYGLNELDKVLDERAPVMRPTFDRQAATLRETLGTSTGELAPAAREERDKALDEIKAICQEVLDISFSALALGDVPPDYDARPPFRGLYAFRLEDKEFFFGREELVEKLRVKLTEDNFLPVLGPSGSGKSSLVLAGLLPTLQRATPELRMAYMTPGSEPLNRLEASLAEARGSNKPWVLVADQFEELFTLCTDEGNRQAFLQRLLALAQEERVIVTMRADFWGECAPYEELKARMQARQELIAPMDATELRRAMEMQAGKVGLRFEADLSNTILEDVRGEPGAMPLLQHALLELWKRRHGRWLLAREYRELGGVQRAIARTADDLYDTLQQGERDRVRDIFVRLTRLGEDSLQGDERRDTRRRVRMDELVPAGQSPAEVIALVKRLADARLVVTNRDALSGKDEVEVGHEALIRYWPRLRQWLDEDRAKLRLREGIREAALEWESKGRDENLLVHRGSRLEEAEALARQSRFALNELEKAYVDGCVALREREKSEEEAQRRRELEQAQALAEEQRLRADEQAASSKRLRARARLLAALALATLLVAVVAAGLAFVASAERDRADEQANIALSRQLAAQSGALMGSQYDLALLLSVESRRPYDTVEARSSLQIALEHEPRLTTILREHQEQVYAATFSPDGKTLASAGCGHTTSGACDRGVLTLWNVASMRPITAPLIVTGTGVYNLAFSPDGRTLAWAGRSGRVNLWDLTDITRVQDHGIVLETPSDVRSLAFSPTITNPLLAAGRFDGAISVWDLAARTVAPRELKMHREPVNSVAFSADGRTLASGSSDRTVVLWDLGTGSPRLAPLAGHDGAVSSVAFSPDGRTLASGSHDRTIRLWDLSTEPLTSTLLTGHNMPVSSLAFGPDGNSLVSGSIASSAILWSVTEKRELWTLTGHDAGVSAVAFNSDGRTIATASLDTTVRLWDWTRDERLGTNLYQPGAPSTSMAIAGDARRVAASDAAGVVGLWEPTSGGKWSQKHTLASRRTRIRSLAYAPDGNSLASGGEDGTIMLTEAESGQIRPLPSLEVPIAAMAFSPDGKKLAAGACARFERDICRAGRVVLFDVPSGKVERDVQGHGAEVAGLVFSPNGRTLASAGLDNNVLLWDLAASPPIPRQLQGHGDWVLSLAFDPSGKLLASGSRDRAIRLWNTGDGKPAGRGPLISQGAYPTSLAFSPDGRTLAAGHNDGKLTLWDVAAEQPIGAPLAAPVESGNAGSLPALAYSTDGKRLIAGNTSAGITGWEVDAGSWEEIACRVANRNLRQDEWDRYVGSGWPYQTTCPDVSSTTQAPVIP